MEGEGRNGKSQVVVTVTAGSELVTLLILVTSGHEGLLRGPDAKMEAFPSKSVTSARAFRCECRDGNAAVEQRGSVALGRFWTANCQAR